MRHVRILEEAAQEAVAAAEWYDQQHFGLGDEFTEAVDAAIDLIEEDILPLSPFSKNIDAIGVKRLVLKRFPYDIVVREHGDESIVVAIAHHARKPGYWNGRISP